MRRLLLLAAGIVAVPALASCSGSTEADGASPTAWSGSAFEGAGPEEKASGQITVAAASDLRNVLAAVQPDIERRCETHLTLVFGSSGQLKNQVEAGADFGLYLSADSQYPRDLAAKGLVVPNGVASYGVGRIVLATRAGIEPVTALKGLTSEAIRRIAIANPGHAPYGRAAKEALESAGVYGDVEKKLVLGENIRQTTDYVEKGDADAGIVALALVIKGSPASYSLIDSALHQPIEQGGAVIKGTGAELTGRCVLQSLLDPEGQAALGDYGFEEVPR
ncbi:MAG: molybdate ABC transporter substrate-binding protein [Dehalococcoidia bacterium]|nr:molybdate ABC transporter substrate-binding protein [Dehalococcoidia bacterium]